MSILQRKIFKPASTLACKSLIGLMLSSSLLAPCFAADLMDVYQAAVKNDALYQAAVSTRLSTREAVPQSVAALLPYVSGKANINSEYNASKTPAMSPSTPGRKQFASQSYSVSLTQPLLDLGSWLKLGQANNAARAADANLVSAAQALIYRVANAYFQVLLAQDNLHLARSEKSANAEQLKQAQQRVRAGLDAITTLYQAKAAYDKSLAAEITAQNTLRNSQEAIRQITGQLYTTLKPFKRTLPLLSPQPIDVEQWINTSTASNLNLMASRYALQVARDNIKVQAAGHLPTLNFVGSYTRNQGQSVNLGIENPNSAMLGLQLNVPIFAGGGISANTRKAEYDSQTAQANLDNEYRQVIVVTRQKYNDVLADISKIKAEHQAIKSAQLSLTSTQQSFSAGTRTIVDVLLARQNLYEARRNAASDQYTYLLDTLLLKQAAGTLKPDDLQQINRWLIC